MVNLIRRDPFLEPLPTVGMMSRLMDRFLNEPLTGEPSGGVGGLLEGATGTLPLDISEDDQNLIVRASLPGFSKDEVNVEVQNGIVSINAEHREEHEEKDERFVRRERRFGSMMRRIALPTNVKEDQCEAELRNGVLTLRIPKSEQAMPRKISIREGQESPQRISAQSSSGQSSPGGAQAGKAGEQQGGRDGGDGQGRQSRK